MIMRNLFAALSTLALLAGSATAFDLGDMSDQEREAFRNEVRAYLMDNPEVIMEAVDLLRRQEDAAAAMTAEEEFNRDLALVAQNADDLFNDPISFVGGNPDGDITIVEFLDYRCGYCRQAHSEVANLLKSDGNIRWIVKEYPILGQASMDSSQVALATKRSLGDDAYLKMHDSLMRFGGQINDASIKRLARAADLDGDKIIAAFDDEQILEHISNVRDLGQRMLVSGTPTFLIGDVIIRGYIQPDQFRAIIQQVREES